MEISFNWLKKYIDLGDITPDEVASILTDIGLEVEEFRKIETIRGGLQGVVVGHVVECEDHPDSDHLHVTKVDVGTGELLNIVCGAIVILLGLSYLEIIRIPFFTGMKTAKKAGSVLSAFVFGVIYSVSLTPCIGAFLGSALMMASSSGGAVRGALLLLCYTAGLGIPFLISAVLIDGLQSAFRFIKQHYRVINTVSGIFLILIGLCMMLGWMNRLMALFS
mgnify:CR=1 FL=1